METIEKLTPESNLRVIVDTLNKFIEMGNINTKTLMTLTKSSGEPIKVFEATQNALITGEVYTLEMSGMYQIVTSGQGRTKAIIKDHKTDTVIDTIILNNAAQSKLYFLSEGDKVYVHSSPAGTSKMTTEFMVVQTMYDLMEESNIASIKQEVDTKLTEFEAQIGEFNDTRAGWINMVAQGCDNTGVTDCSDIINNAIKKANIGTFYFPQGTYLMSKPLSIISKNNFKLIGDNATIILNSPQYSEIKTSKNIEISGLTLIAKNATDTRVKILEFSTCEQIRISNCIIDGNSQNTNKTQTQHGLVFKNCKDVVVSSCEVKNIWYRYGLVFEKCSMVKLLYNYLHHIGGAGIELNHGNTDFVIDGNTLYYCNINDLGDDYSEASDGCIDTYGPTDETTKPNSNIIIQNNDISCYGVTGRSYSGLRVSGSTHIKVLNNKVYNSLSNNTFCVMVQDRGNTLSKDVLFQGNSIFCETGYYIGTFKVQSGGDNIIIDSNIFDSIAAGVTSSYGSAILCTNKCKGVNLVNNKIGTPTNKFPCIGIIMQGGSQFIISRNEIYCTNNGINLTNVSKTKLENNLVNGTHNYQIKLETCTVILLLYNIIGVSNGVIYKEGSTEVNEVGTYKWV